LGMKIKGLTFLMSTEGNPGNQIIMTNISKKGNGIPSTHSKVSLQEYSDQDGGVEHTSLENWIAKKTVHLGLERKFKPMPAKRKRR